MLSDIKEGAIGFPIQGVLMLRLAGRWFYLSAVCRPESSCLSMSTWHLLATKTVTMTKMATMIDVYYNRSCVLMCNKINSSRISAENKTMGFVGAFAGVVADVGSISNIDPP